MMMDNGDGSFIAGGLDVLCILHNVNTNRYHAAFFEEKPYKIQPIEETDIVRLQCKMHHTSGSETLEGALEELEKLSEKIIISKENIMNTPIDWNGELGITFVCTNWRKTKTLNIV